MSTSSILKRHNVRVSGSGEVAMMFAHGFGCDQNMWRYVAPVFERDFRVVMFDYLGHGQSDRSAYVPHRYDTLDGYAEDVLDICDALDVRHGVFVGHSVSAMVGVLASAREPARFDRLVLVGPSPRYINDDDTGYVGGFTRSDIDGLIESLDSNFLGWSSTMAPVIMGAPDRPELGAELTNSFCRTDPEVAKQFARATFLSDNRADLPRVAASCLVLQCAHDVIAPESVGRYVHEHLPQSQFVQLSATGHCPNLSAPEETVDAIRAFLR